MMDMSLPLFAQEVTRRTFQWGRLERYVDWLPPVGGAVWILLALAAVVILIAVRLAYGRDARALGRPVVSWLLTLLRAAAFFGLLMFFLQPEWRTEREVQRNSRVLVLVDTSSSMGLADVDTSTPPGGANRVEQVAAVLDTGEFLPSLRKTHDVVLLRFDEDLGRIVSLDKLPAEGEEGADAASAPEVGGGETSADPVAAERIDWREALTPDGLETRLGQALRQLLYEERNAPIAAVVLFSDGGQNAGMGTEPAVELAREARIPVYTVGLGTTEQPANVRVYKLEAVPRAYPGDPYTVTGLVQGQRMAGKSLTVELRMRDAEDKTAEEGTGTVVRRQEVIIGADGESVPVRFELTPEETGRKIISLAVEKPPGDHNPDDNVRETEVEVLDRKDRVLLFAGGPMREYRFLRSQLFRDASMTVDVLLQTAQPGISQDVDTILDDFPLDREEMYQYDCVVAFDPDWAGLSAKQIDLLESWIGEQGGGMIAVAGGVYAGEPVTGWVENDAAAKVRALYPVEFPRRISVVEAGSYTSKDPWPLDFTREGLEAEYLWLDDSATASQQAWAAFPGVYSCFPVEGPKPAAVVLARFSDPRARLGDDQPVLMAEQFYGSGRVFYLGSGEMWRLRQVDPAYFERFYTRLVRHVTQGRLLRQSSRGTLLVGQDRYVLGSTVRIRAQLTDVRLEPLDVPEVNLEVTLPSGAIQTVVLRADPSRVGMYAGQITALAEGVYRLELPVPESDEERLSRRIQVVLPDLERENPQRDDALLARLADGTGGKYYDKLIEAVDPRGADPLVARLKDRTKTVIFAAAPDPLFEEPWLFYLLLAICGVLCLEWLIRRLFKLA